MKFLILAHLLVSSLLLSPNNGQAEGSVFRRGSVLTSEGTFTGELKVDFEHSTLVLRQDNQYKHLNAKMIISATVEDAQFVGLEFDGAHYLFEVLYTDSQTLVFRENLKYQYSEGTEQFLPFFFVENGSLQPVYKSKDLMAVFGADEKWMSVFVKSNNLDLSIKADLKSALDYYTQQKI